MSTLLQNVQDALTELGLSRPSTVVTSSDTIALQMLALFNRVGDALQTEDDWQFLATEYRFQTVAYSYTGDLTAGSTTISNLSSVTGLTTDFMVAGAGVNADTLLTSVGVNSAVMSQPASATATGVALTFGQAKYSMPSDYDRMVNKTQFNKSSRWTIIGPKDAQEWQWLKSSYIQAGPRQRYRIVGNQFVIWPAPTAGQMLGFEYQSNGWVVSNAGVRKSRFTADDDTSLFPDRLLIMGAKMRFLEAKGLDSSAEAAYFARELSKFKAQNGGADTLSLAPKRNSLLLTTANLPDSGIGVS